MAERRVHGAAPGRSGDLRRVRSAMPFDEPDAGSLYRAQGCQHFRRRHGQIREPEANGVANGIGHRRRCGHKWHFADAANALWVFVVWPLDHDRREQGDMPGTGHAVVEEAWVAQPPAGIINALLVESPADPLGHAALHLALDVAWMDGATDVLECGVAQNGHLA